MASTPKKSVCPKPPPDLSGEALAEWGRITDDLHKAGKLDKSDRAILVAYCRLWPAFKELSDHVAIHGVITQQFGAPGASPHFKQLLPASRELRQLLAELGLTPAARGLAAKTEEMSGPELVF